MLKTFERIVIIEAWMIAAVDSRVVPIALWICILCTKKKPTAWYTPRPRLKWQIEVLTWSFRQYIYFWCLWLGFSRAQITHQNTVPLWCIVKSHDINATIINEVITWLHISMMLLTRYSISLSLYVFMTMFKSSCM